MKVEAQFEAYFVRQMLNESKVGETLFSGPGASTFASMFNEALADEIAAASPMSLGDVLTKGGLSTFPVSGAITSDFGHRADPITGEHRHHDGLDIAAPLGSDVRAAGGGRVKEVSHSDGYGRMVVIDHGDGLTSRYAHLQSASVKVGDTINPGQTIGAVGNSGRSTGPHLHFEVRIGKNPVDPKKMMGAP